MTPGDDDGYRVMPEYGSYEAARERFDWHLLDDYDPAVDLLRKHDPADPAVHHVHGDAVETHTFGELDERSNRLAGALESLGVSAGDRVGVCIPQRPANPVTHLACWKLGASTVPLTVLFGTDALRYRLDDAEAVALVADTRVRETVEAVRDDCAALRDVVYVDGVAEGRSTHEFDTLLADGPAAFDPYDSTPETETAVMYTSGSTGPPKGVVHSHALWLGRAAAAHNFFEGYAGADTVVWTPADWAWGAALGGTLFGAWHHGHPVVAAPRGGFDPECAFSLLADHDVTHAFMPPTALRMLMSVEAPADRFDLSLSVLATAGEPLTPEVLEWVDADLPGVSCNEFYGQTELNLAVATRSDWFDPKPGSMGRPLPGYDLAILDRETRDPLPTGETGEIALHPGDRRVFFDRYLGKPEATREKTVDLSPDDVAGTDLPAGEWFLTDDLATRDEDGYVHFVSRADDVILTSGYRVGPLEVEKALLEHPAVEQAGVVGLPDETRGERIVAFLERVPEGSEGTEGQAGSSATRGRVPEGTAGSPDDELREELRTLVRERLAEYEYPREIRFVEDLPKTSTGKVRRASLRERETDE
jgi:acetyl-CoA synthetase